MLRNIFKYDDDGLMTQAGDLTATYDPENGAITGTTIGNVTDSYKYTEFGEVERYAASVSGVEVYSSSFTYDKLGRISTKTEKVNGETYTYRYGYDSIGQLTDVWVDGSLKSHYDYDSNGNRVGGMYDAQDRMITYGENTYQYSANGELQQKVTPTGTTKYEYDVLGNLTAVTLEDGTKIEYVIDGANRRVGKKVNGVLVQGWLYQDGLKPVAELDGNGNVVSRFVYGTSAITPDYMVKNGTTYRIICDHLGSPRVIIETATGQVVERIDYDEFGNVVSDTNPGFIPFGFAGGLYDRNTKLTRFGFRDYASEIGRWTAKDPVGFGGGNLDLYGYCGDNPVNKIDPLGLKTTIYILSGSVNSFVLLANSPILRKV